MAIDCEVPERCQRVGEVGSFAASVLDGGPGGQIDLRDRKRRNRAVARAHSVAERQGAGAGPADIGRGAAVVKRQRGCAGDRDRRAEI